MYIQKKERLVAALQQIHNSCYPACGCRSPNQFALYALDQLLLPVLVLQCERQPKYDHIILGHVSRNPAAYVAILVDTDGRGFEIGRAHV